jgi:hypothetical protein
MSMQQEAASVTSRGDGQSALSNRMEFQRRAKVTSPRTALGTEDVPLPVLQNANRAFLSSLFSLTTFAPNSALFASSLILSSLTSVKTMSLLLCELSFLYCM